VGGWVVGGWVVGGWVVGGWLVGGCVEAGVVVGVLVVLEATVVAGPDGVGAADDVIVAVQPAAQAAATASVVSRRARVRLAESPIPGTVGARRGAIPFAHGSPGAVAALRPGRIVGGRRPAAGPGVSAGIRRGRSPWEADPLGAVVLLILTAIAGGLDAIAFLSLGGTFVSNQTGTVLILAMGASGTAQVRAVLGVTSLCCFLIGAGLAGRMLPVTAAGEPWPRHTRTVIVAEAFLITVCAVLTSIDQVDRAFVVGLAALAMGGQTTLARRVGLAYLTTGFVTGAAVAAAMSSPLGDRSSRWWWFAVIPISALVAGAAAASLVSRISTELALAMLVVFALTATVLTSTHPHRVHAPVA
jgi:uncharacterized membrane protein YoaK (UPF0700 family)